MILIIAYSVKNHPEIFFEINENVDCKDEDNEELVNKYINDLKCYIVFKFKSKENPGIRTFEEHENLFNTYMEKFDDYFVYAVTTIIN